MKLLRQELDYTSERITRHVNSLHLWQVLTIANHEKPKRTGRFYRITTNSRSTTDSGIGIQSESKWTDSTQGFRLNWETERKWQKKASFRSSDGYGNWIGIRSHNGE